MFLKKRNKEILTPEPEAKVQEQPVIAENSESSEKSLEGFYKISLKDQEGEVSYVWVGSPHKRFSRILCLEGSSDNEDKETIYDVSYSDDLRYRNSIEISHSSLKASLKNAQPATREEYVADRNERFETIKEKFYKMKPGDVYYSFSCGSEHWLYRVESVYKLDEDPVKAETELDDITLLKYVPCYSYRVLYRYKKITDKDYSEDIMTDNIVDFLYYKKEGDGIVYQA